MPRLTNEQINSRIRQAMAVPTQPGGTRQKVSPEAFQSLIQKAQQMRGAGPAAKPGIKPSPVQRADMRARALPTKREEEERW